MAITQTTIRVLWDGYSPDDIGNSPITGFKLGISSDNENFVYTTVAADVRMHTFTGLTPATTYYLTLQGVNAIGESEPVKLTATTIDTVTEVPDVPTLSLYQSNVDEVQVTASVPDFSSKEVDSVEVQQSTDGVSFASLHTFTAVNAATLHLSDGGLVVDTTYYYRARSTNRVGNSDWSPTEQITVERCADRCAVVEDTNVRWEDATPEQKKTLSFILEPGQEDHCGPYRECPPEPVGKVQNLRISNITHNSADATWAEPLRTGGYAIIKYVLNLGADDFDVDGTSVQLTELTPETQYTLSVKAVNGLGTVGVAASATFTTIAAPPPPPKPKPNAPNLDSVSVNERDRAVIIFDKSTDRVNKPVETYKIYERTTTQDILLKTVNDSDFPGDFNQSVLVSLTRLYTVAGTYRFFMRAANSDAESDDSNVVHFTIEEPEPEVPDAPVFESLTRSDAGVVTASFSYRNQGHAATSFKIYEDLSTDVVRKTVAAQSFRSGQNKITLNTTLDQSYTTPGTYSFYVVATNADGDSDRSRILSFTVAAVVPDRAPSAPRDLRIVTNISSRQKVLAWDSSTDLGKPPITDYSVFVYDENVPNARLLSRVSLSSFVFVGRYNYTFFGQYNKNYRAFVRAQNSAGHSDSNIISFSTGEGRPTPPRNLSLALVNEINVRATWQVPSATNGTITAYRLYYRELLSGRRWTQVDLGNVLTHTVEGLQRGKTYEFEVTAFTSAGESTFTNNPQSITIPDYEKPGAVGLSCSLQDQDFVLRFTPPNETGGANLFRYRVAVTVPGQTRIRYLYYNYPQTSGVVVDESIKTLFSLTNLPSGTYSFAASVRNTELDEYSDVNSGSRCTINYTAPVSRPKKVTNIQFTKPSTNLVMTFVEPTDSGAYTFAWLLTLTDNRTGAVQRAAGRVTKTNPNASTQTITTNLTGEVFDNTTISARITSSKTGTLETAVATKVQVYEDIVNVANPPVVNSIELYSDNVPRINFNYPLGHEPITQFRVYEVIGLNSVLRATITNDSEPNDRNIIKKVGTATYTNAGTYRFYMTSVNSAGESNSSNNVEFTITPPPPPPPPPVPNSPTLVSVRKGANDRQLVLVWDWPTGTAPVTSIKFYEYSGNPGVSSNTLVGTVDVSGVVLRRNISTTLNTSRARTASGIYFFYAVATNASGDSVRSNYVWFRIAAPPPPAPDAPILRRVERTSGNNARFIFDYPSTGSTPKTFKFYNVGGGLIGSVTALNYYRGQTSISYTVSSFFYSSPGTHSFYMRASNDSGDSPNSATRSFTIPQPQTKPNAPVLNDATFDSSDNSLNLDYSLNDVPPNVKGIKVRIESSTTINQTITFPSTVTAASFNRTEKITSFISSDPGTYTVSLVAFNDDGDSVRSNQISYIIPEPPDGTPPVAPVLSSPYDILHPRRHSGSGRNQFKIDVTISSTTPIATHIFLVVGSGINAAFAGIFRVRPGRNTFTINAVVPSPTGSTRYDIGRSYDVAALAYYVLNNEKVYSTRSNTRSVYLIRRTFWITRYFPRT